ncbi:MAG: glycosyltransferase [bacterium]
MRILLLNNPFFAEALRKLGHEVLSSQPNHGDLVESSPAPDIHDILDQMPSSRQPDLIIAVEGFEEKVYYRNLNLCDIPTVFWAIDTHVHLRWMAPYSQEFDLTCVAQRDHVERFPSARWLPLCFPRMIQVPFDNPRDIPVSFIGNLKAVECPQRYEFLKALQERVPILIGSGDYVEAYKRSAIILNHCVAGDLNFRVFEALACGGMLLTPDIKNGQNLLFEPGLDLATYRSGDVDDAVRLIDHYLNCTAERHQIAMNGYLKTYRSHTIINRAQSLLEMIEPWLVQKRKKKKTSAGLAVKLLGERYYWIYHHGSGIFPREQYLEAARDCLQQAIVEASKSKSNDQAPDLAEMESLLGDIYLSGYGDVEKAQLYFQRAQHRSPDLYSAILGMGHIHRELGDLQAALRWYEEAARKHPQEAEGFHFAALAALELQQWERASYWVSLSEQRGHRNEQVITLLNRMKHARLAGFTGVSSCGSN